VGISAWVFHVAWLGLCDYLSIFMDPRYASRRQELLDDGVDPADLRMFGAALTQGISPSKKVTNTVVAVCTFSALGLVSFSALSYLVLHAELQGTILTHAAAGEESSAQVSRAAAHSRGITLVNCRRYPSPRSEHRGRVARWPRDASRPFRMFPIIMTLPPDLS